MQLVIGLALLAVTLAAFYFIKQRNKFSANSQLKVFAVKAPIAELGIGVADFLSFLTNLKIPFSAEVELPHVGSDLSFHIGIPSQAEEAVRKYAGRLWPGASFTPASHNALFSKDSVVAAVYLSAKDSAPLHTKANFSKIIKFLSDLNFYGAGAAFQVLIRPANDKSLTANLRLIAAHETILSAETIIEDLTKIFQNIGASVGLEFKKSAPRDREKFLDQFLNEKFDSAQAVSLTANQLHEIFSVVTNTNNFEAQNISHTDEIFKSNPHLCLVGTGENRANFFLKLALENTSEKRGLAIVGAGSLIKDFLNSLPKSRYEDLIVFDPSAKNHRLPINILEISSQATEYKNLRAELAAGLISRFFGGKKGENAAVTQCLKAAIQVLLSSRDSSVTLFDVIRFFTKPEFQAVKLRATDNQFAKIAWQAASSDHKALTEARSAAEKLGEFLSNPSLKRSINSRASFADFRDIIRRGKIFIADAPTDTFGWQAADFLHCLAIANLFAAAEALKPVRFDLYAAGLSEESMRWLHDYAAHATNCGIRIVSGTPSVPPLDLKKEITYVKIPLNMQIQARQVIDYQIGDKLREYSIKRYGTRI